MEELTLIPVFANQKTSEEDFHFYEKKVKLKNSTQCFAAIPCRVSTHSEAGE